MRGFLIKSRIAKTPVPVPSGVEVSFDGNLVTVSGSKGKMEFMIPASVTANHADEVVTIAYDESSSTSTALAGTTRLLAAVLASQRGLVALQRSPRTTREAARPHGAARHAF